MAPFNAAMVEKQADASFLLYSEGLESQSEVFNELA